MLLANLLGAFDGPDLLIILLIVLLLFGGTKLPQLARSLGQAKREFHAGSMDRPATDTSDAQAQPDTVTIPRDELDRLRARADQHAPDHVDPTSN